MDALHTIATILGSTTVVAVIVLRSSLRALIGWAVGIASRQVELVAILGRSLTLFLLSLVIAYLRRLEAHRSPGGLHGLER